MVSGFVVDALVRWPTHERRHDPDTIDYLTFPAGTAPSSVPCSAKEALSLYGVISSEKFEAALAILMRKS